MKDLVQIWNRVTGRAGNERELGDLPNNRLNSIDTSAFEGNLAECEGLNNKFNDDLDFTERKDAIINRLFERRKKGKLTRQPKCLFVLLLLGFLAIGLGLFILLFQPYNIIFNWKVTLGDGGEIFEIWRKPEVNLYCRIFLFNITNAEEYMSGKADKIIVDEVGPYVYKEDIEHKVTKFNDNGTLSAIPNHPLTWMEDLSEGHHEDDILYLPHIALLSIANVVSKQNYFTRFGLNNVITLTNSKPIMRMTAKEFMLGYKSQLMTMGNTFMPGWIYFDKLGLIDRMYDFEGDYETIFTGETDVRNAGLIDTYRGSVDLPQWTEKHCSNVQYASDGTKFKGGVERNESVLFFRKSLCRAAPLIPTEEGSKNGLKAYLYTLPEHLLDNGKHIEENKCFCRHGKCLPEGLIDVTDCYYGFPIALSYPHFYKGDDILFSKVDGLSPSKEKHETRFWIQPETGLPLDVSAKFQINMALGDISGITNTERFAHMYLPMLWFDIRMYALTPSLEKRFKMYINILPVVEQAGMYLLFISGAALVLFTIHRLTMKLMFKTVSSDGKKQRNFVIGTDMWIDKERNRQRSEKEIYSPCEVPLQDSDTDNSDPQFDTDRRPSFLKSQSDKIKELSHRLTDKVYDSVGNVKDMVSNEITNVKAMFDRKNSLIKDNDDGFKSDSGDEYAGGYKVVKQNDSEDDCKYLEIVDDGSGFDDPMPRRSSGRSNLEDLEKIEKDNEVILHINE